MSGRIIDGDAAQLAKATATIETLTAELRKRDEEIGAWQDASGLCVPAEEHGGDPSGVRPRHLARDIAKRDQETAKLTAERDSAIAASKAHEEEIARLRQRNEFVEREWQAEIKIRKASDVGVDLAFKLQAKLGSAVTALQGARHTVVAAMQQPNGEHRRAHREALLARIDAILADADSAAAGDNLCQFKYADGSYCFSAAGNPCPTHRGDS